MSLHCLFTETPTSKQNFDSELPISTFEPLTRRYYISACCINKHTTGHTCSYYYEHQPLCSSAIIPFFSTDISACFWPYFHTDSDVGMTTVNRCLDAAKACNVDDLCQKLRTEYVSACIKPTSKSGLCNRPKCNKALRRFFDRVPADYTHELLFCPCTDTACAERRRQTIVPSCSYESMEKPSCISQMRICNADYVCRLERKNGRL